MHSYLRLGPYVDAQPVGVDENRFSNGELAKKRRKIRIVGGNAKCRHLNKLTSKGSLRQVIICLRPRTPYPPTLTVYVYTVYLFTQGRGERGEFNQREG